MRLRGEFEKRKKELAKERSKKAKLVFKGRMPIVGVKKREESFGHCLLVGLLRALRYLVLVHFGFGKGKEERRASLGFWLV